MRFIRYFDEATNQWEFASIRDVGNLNELFTRERDSIVDAINSIIGNPANRPSGWEDRDINDIIDELLGKAGVEWVNGRLESKVDWEDFIEEYNALREDLENRVSVEDFEERYQEILDRLQDSIDRELLDQLAEDLREEARLQAVYDANQRAELLAQIQENRTDIDNARENVDNMRDAINERIDGVDDVIRDAQSDISAIEDNIIEINSDLSGINITLGQNTSDINGLNGRLTTVEITAEGLTADMSSVQTDLSGVQTNVASLQVTAEGLVADMTSVTEGLNSTITRVGVLEVTSEGLLAEFVEVNETLDSHTSRIGSLEVTASGLEASFGQFESDLGSAQSQIAQLVIDVNGLTSTVQAINEEFDEITGELTSLSARTASIEQRADSIELNVQSIETEMGDLGERVSNNEAEIAINAYQIGLRVTQDYFNEVTGELNSQMASITIEQGSIISRVESVEFNVNDPNGTVANRIGTAIYQLDNEIRLEVTRLETSINGVITSTETQIAAMESAIMLRVTNEVSDPLNGRVSSAEGRIDVLEDEIDLRVRHEELDEQFGRNQWIASRFDINLGGAGAVPVFAHIQGLTPSDIVMFDDSSRKQPFTGDHYIAHFFTNVWMQNAGTRVFTVTSDDTHNVFLNGAQISSGGTVSLSLRQGWNTIEILHYEHTGAEHVTFSPTVSSQVDRMTAHIGIGDRDSTRLTHAEAGIRIALDEISITVNKIEELDYSINAQGSGILARLDGVEIFANETTHNEFNNRITANEGRIAVLPTEITLSVREEMFDPLNNRFSEAEAQIQVLSDAIDLMVTERVFDELEGRVSYNETQIQLNTEAILLRATTEQLNQTNGRLTTAEGRINVLPTEILSTVNQTVRDPHDQRITANSTAIQQLPNQILLRVEQEYTDWLLGQMQIASSEISMGINNVVIRATETRFNEITQEFVNVRGEIQTEAGRISLEVAQTQVNNINIGSRNLLNNTSDSPVNFSFSGWQSHRETVTAFGLEEIRRGGDFFVGMDILTRTGTEPIGLMLHVSLPNGQHLQRIMPWSQALQQGQTGRIGWVANIPPNPAAINANIAIRHNAGTAGQSTGTFARSTLVRTNRNADWTPAPENMASQNDITANAIVSRIVLEPNSINLLSENINLTGRVTFNSLAPDAQGRITGANSAAQNAQNTANSANTLAGTANTNAQNAQNAANAAQTTANTVQTTVNNNQANWTNAFNRVNEWAFGAPTGSTTIDGGRIQTHTILANRIALGDFTNFAQLNQHTASQYGWSIVNDAANPQNPWFQRINIARDNPIGENFSVNGGEVFHATVDIDTNVQGAAAAGGANAGHRGVSIGFRWILANGTNQWNWVSRVTNAVGTASGQITAPPTARTAQVWVQIEGHAPWTGHLRIRNARVNRMADGELIVNGSITGQHIIGDRLSAIFANLGEVTAGILRNQANTFNINLDTGVYRSEGSVNLGGGVTQRSLIDMRNGIITLEREYTGGVAHRPPNAILAGEGLMFTTGGAEISYSSRGMQASDETTGNLLSGVSLRNREVLVQEAVLTLDRGWDMNESQFNIEHRGTQSRIVSRAVSTAPNDVEFLIWDNNRGRTWFRYRGDQNMATVHNPLTVHGNVILPAGHFRTDGRNLDLNVDGTWRVSCRTNGTVGINGTLQPTGAIQMTAGNAGARMITSGNVRLNGANSMENHVQTLWIGGWHQRVTGTTGANDDRSVVLSDSWHTNGSNRFNLGVDTNGPRIQSWGIHDRTTTAASNIHITNQGVMARVTSTRRNKLSIEKVNVDNLAHRLLEIEPKSWYDKGQMERYADYLTRLHKGEEISPEGDTADYGYCERIAGLIAEDVVEAGLGMYAFWGEKGENGRELQGVQYERLWTLLIPLVREQRDRIEKLEEMVEMLLAK